MRQTPRRIAAITLAAAALLLGLYAVVGFLVLPGVIEREVPRQARDRLGTSASVSDVDFNPFLLALSADDVRVDGREGKPAIRAERLAADLSWSSLWRRDWRFDSVHIDAPIVDLAIQPDGTLNLPRPGDSPQPGNPAQPGVGGDPGARAGSGMPDLYVGELRVRRGTVNFTDRTQAAPETHRLRWADIELDRLSTHRDARGDLLATAVLPRGGAFATRARLSLAPIAATGALRVSGLSAAVPWSLVHEPNGVLARGRLDFGLHYDFSYRDRVPTLRVSAIDLRAEGLALHESGNGPTPPLALERVEMRDARFDLASRELVVPELRLAGGAVRAAVDGDGTLNWQRLFTLSPRTQASAPAQALRVAVERLSIEQVDLDYVDRSRAQPLQVAAADLGGTLAFALETGSNMAFSGEATELAGRDFVIRAHGSRDPPALDVERVSLRGAAFDFSERLVRLPEVKLDRGTLRLDTGRDGTLNWQRLFTAAPETTRTPSSKAGAQRPAGDPAAWRILLPKLGAENMDVAMTDLTRARPLSVRAADIAGSVDLAITPGAPQGTVALDDIRLNGRRLVLQEVGAKGEPALRVDALETAGGHFRGQDILLSGLRLRGGRLQMLIDASGVANWTRLSAARPEARQRATQSAKSVKLDAWRVRLPGLRVDGVGVRYRDASRALPLEIIADSVHSGLDLSVDTGAKDPLRIARMDARAAAFRLGAVDAPAALRLARVEASDGALRSGLLRFARVRLADGTVVANIAPDGNVNLQRMFETRKEAASSLGRGLPRDSQGLRVRLPRVEIAGLRVEGIDRSRTSPLALQAAPVNGSLAIEVDADGVHLRDGALRAQGLVLSRVEQGEALARLDDMQIDGAAVDTQRRTVSAKTLLLRDGALSLVRGADGKVEMLQALSTRGNPDAAGSSPADERPWQYRLVTLRVENLDVGLADRSFGGPIAYQLDVNGSVSGLDSTAATGAEVAMRLDIQPGGRARVSGRLPGNAEPMKLRLVLDGLPLQPMQPALAHYAALELKSGALDADAVLSTGKAEDGAPLRVSGSVDVEGLRLDEEKTGERFLAWKGLHAQSINFDAAARRAVVGRAVLDGVQAHLEISREGELNFKQLLRESAQAAGGAAPEGDKAAREDAFVALVDQLRIRDGTLRFADRSLVLPFVTDITELNGTMVSLSTRTEDRARLQLDGRVQPFGAARARGEIQLADPRSFTDIRAEFNNVPLPKLSPYTITFAGRAVAEGRLWLDLQYRIVNGDLVGENAITMQDLRLGERVAAPRAVDLPLELAMALLTDDQGVLTLRVPVRGDLDNPTFDYKTVIRAAIANTLRRAVTAPFRLIGRMFGPDVEELDAIEFEPGSASLRPPEQEKLNVVAQAMNDRPKLALEVQGSYAAEEDARALRATALEGDLAQRMKLELGEGERMGPIAFGQTATQLALEEMFAKQFGGQAAETLRARLASEAKDARAVRRVDRKAGDPIGAAGDPDLYRAMFERLVERQPVDPAALRQLAAQRTQSVLDYVVGQAGTPEQRLTVAATDAVQAKEDLVPTRLRLRVAGTGKDVPMDLETVDKPQPEEREAAPAR